VESEEVQKQDKKTEKKKAAVETIKTNKECLDTSMKKAENVDRSDMEKSGVEDLIGDLKDSVK
jgi:hypothetical protein